MITVSAFQCGVCKTLAQVWISEMHAAATMIVRITLFAAWITGGLINQRVLHYWTLEISAIKIINALITLFVGSSRQHLLRTNTLNVCKNISSPKEPSLGGRLLTRLTQWIQIWQTTLIMVNIAPQDLPSIPISTRRHVWQSKTYFREILNLFSLSNAIRQILMWSADSTLTQINWQNIANKEILAMLMYNVNAPWLISWQDFVKA